MKATIFRAINKITILSTLTIGFSATVNAASYQMTIVSGTNDTIVYGPPSETITDLTGQAVNFTVTDDYQQLTINEGLGGNLVGMYKTLTFSSGGNGNLYSSDGIKFFYGYWGGCTSCSQTASATLNGGSLTYSYDSMHTGFGEIHEKYVATTPLPAAMWLFGSGLFGLVSFSRKRKAS